MSGFQVLPITNVISKYTIMLPRSPTIVMSDPRLYLLPAIDSRIVRVGHHIHEGNPIETNHLFEIDESTIIAVHVFQGDAKVCSIRV